MQNRERREEEARVRVSRLTYAIGAQCRRGGQGASIQARENDAIRPTASGGGKKNSSTTHMFGCSTVD
jgi:hypothetical protein